MDEYPTFSPLGHSQKTYACNVMFPPLFNAVRTWKHEREMLSPPQISQQPWEDVLAWPVLSDQLAKPTHFSIFFLLFIFMSLSDISCLHNCTQFFYSKAAPLLRADCTPFTGKSQLSVREGYRPWASRRQNTPCFSALCGSQWLLSFICHLGASLLLSPRCLSVEMKVFMPRLTTPCTHCTWRWGTKSPASIFFQEMLQARHSSY